VRCVCISGSLSKGYMDKNSDVDYFIITAPGRLWLSRTLLVLFKKIFLFNSRKYFCVNYFIDEDSLEIPEKNLFTATELSYLLPVYNYELYSALIMKNGWCREFYPNKRIVRHTMNIPYGKGRGKRLAEWLLGGWLGERLDTLCLKLTLKRWKKKFGYLPGEEFEINLRSRKNISKHHPQGFQFQVLRRFGEGQKLFEQESGMLLSKTR